VRIWRAKFALADIGRKGISGSNEEEFPHCRGGTALVKRDEAGEGGRPMQRVSKKGLRKVGGRERKKGKTEGTSNNTILPNEGFIFQPEGGAFRGGGGTKGGPGGEESRRQEGGRAKAEGVI